MLRLAPEALVDIDEIVRYLITESPSAAERFEQRLRGLFQAIGDNPSIGRSTNRHHIRVVNTHPYPYLVFYQARQPDVRVLRLIHGARNPRSMPAKPR